ncbi:MAG: glycosyltransferase family 2 protein [Bacteroidota bacterium]
MYPYFSIIIPTYNRALFLSKAIESVINQTFSDWELIIVDDGSTDNTKELVASFIEKDKRIKYIYQENAERSAARNNGIKKAVGKFICFLDSDDIYHNAHLQRFKDLIDENNEKVALHFSGVSLNQYDETPCKYNETHQTAQEFVLLNTLATPRACVAKEVFEDHQFNTKIRIGEDRELWARGAKYYPVFYHTYKTCIQIDHSNRSILGKSVFDSYETLKFIFSQHKIRIKIKRELRSNALFNIGKYELTQNHRLKAILFFTKSLVADINNKQSKLKVNVLIRLGLLQKLQKTCDLIGN